MAGAIEQIFVLDSVNTFSMIISSNSFNDSSVLLKCFILALNEKDAVKFTRGNLFYVFSL